jgi:isoleucyl-tRNA synthetase
VALSDYQSDLKISDGILKQTAEQYRKIRNTFRFLLANVGDLDSLVDVSEYGELDSWILAKASDVFAQVNDSFAQNDFLRGFAILNHFITNELSGIYLDITKDRLYCDAKDSQSQRATQSAMALIAKSMLALVAPTLTYTADEILDHSPAIIKGDMQNVFDLVYEPLPQVQSTLNEELLVAARERFYEAIDSLKKDKIIKATLELEISGDVEMLGIKLPKDLEDWFVVSSVSSVSEGEVVASFELEGKEFKVHKATKHKCPRCWRFASHSEDEPCSRCQEVLS